VWGEGIEMSKAKAVQPVQEAAAPSAPVQQRVYKDATSFDHDLFELMDTNMMRNDEPTGWEPIWKAIEHSHFFHTFDSDGRKQIKSVAASGHYHPMEVIDQGPGNVPLVKCGPAMKDVMKKDARGQWKKVSAPVQGEMQHSHEVQWRSSLSMKTRKVNQEAVVAQSSIISKQTANMTSEERSAIRESGSRDSSVE
jgi:hypothetical protein